MKVLYIPLLLFAIICCKTQEIGDCETIVEQADLENQEQLPDQEGTFVGGFQRIPVDSEKAVLAFDFLKEQLAITHPQISQVCIQSAYVQLVAGMKIVLVCKYKTDDECAKIQTLYTLVYVDIRGNKSVVELDLLYGE